MPSTIRWTWHHRNRLVEIFHPIPMVVRKESSVVTPLSSFASGECLIQRIRNEAGNEKYRSNSHGWFTQPVGLVLQVSPVGKVFKVSIATYCMDTYWIMALCRKPLQEENQFPFPFFYIGRCHLHSYECVQCVDDKWEEIIRNHSISARGPLVTVDIYPSTTKGCWI